MQTTHFRHQCLIYSLKIALTVTTLIWVTPSVAQQRYAKKGKQHNINVEKRKFSYGFIVGTHMSAFQVGYSEGYTAVEADTVHSVMTPFSVGFSLGFLVNFKIHEVLDLRLTPQASFYNRQLEYRYTTHAPLTQRVETVMIEFPLLLKYKSMRRGNLRMYVIGGMTPAIDVSRPNREKKPDDINVTLADFVLEAGIGFDIYLPFFKMSPEVRFSRGVINILSPGIGSFNAPLQHLNTNTITFYLIFQ